MTGSGGSTYNPAILLCLFSWATRRTTILMLRGVAAEETLDVLRDSPTRVRPIQEKQGADSTIA